MIKEIILKPKVNELRESNSLTVDIRSIVGVSDRFRLDAVISDCTGAALEE